MGVYCCVPFCKSQSGKVMYPFTNFQVKKPFEYNGLRISHVKVGMNAFKDGWFTETKVTPWGHVQSITIQEVLFHEKSKYQDIFVFKSPKLGHILALDNRVQCCERDEFAYQEMISFLPLNCHPSPKKVLIIGGGDGGILRETLKHPQVESVILCDIDEKVIDVSKEFLPSRKQAFQNPKTEVCTGNAEYRLKSSQEEFDVIIVDASELKDTNLDQSSYYQILKAALRQDGVLSIRGKPMWHDLNAIRKMVEMAKSIFPVVDYATSFVGTFAAGQIGYLLCSNSSETNFREPLSEYTNAVLANLNLKYYSREIHETAFSLPLFHAEGIGLDGRA